MRIPNPNPNPNPIPCTICTPTDNAVVINKISTPITVVAGATVNIPVTVTGFPEPTVQLLKDGEVLSSTVEQRFTFDDRHLTIRDVDAEDRGDYYHC